MKAKIVILNWNGVDHLRRFLPGVVATAPCLVVVADNGSTDDSVEVLRREFPTVELIELDENHGYAGGYNMALEKIMASQREEDQIFILLNSDVQTPAGWCEPLLQVFENEHDTAIVQPKIRSLNEPSKFEYAGAAGGFIDSLGYPFCRGRILNTIEEDHGQYDDRRDIFWASGACMAIRASVFRELNGFDARFFAHMEEIDLCWRAQLKGWRVAVEPHSHVFHLGGGTLAAGSPQKIYLNFRNTLAMMRKNGSRAWRLRMVLDGGSALVYLLTGRWAFCKAVWRAHRDFRRMGIASEVKTRRLSTMYKGAILLRYLFGQHVFGRMMAR